MQLLFVAYDLDKSHEDEAKRNTAEMRANTSRVCGLCQAVASFHDYRKTPRNEEKPNFDLASYLLVHLSTASGHPLPINHPHLFTTHRLFSRRLLIPSPW